MAEMRGQAVIMPRIGHHGSDIHITPHVREDTRTASPAEHDAPSLFPHSMQEQMNEKKPGGKQIRLTSLAACAG